MSREAIEKSLLDFVMHPASRELAIQTNKYPPIAKIGDLSINDEIALENALQAAYDFYELHKEEGLRDLMEQAFMRMGQSLDAYTTRVYGPPL